MPDIINYSPLWGVWSITRPIGSGTFGDVYEAKRTDMGKEYFAAVKHISIPPRGTTLQTLQAEGVATDDGRGLGTALLSRTAGHPGKGD